jgi:hypothetical protein
MTTDKIIFNNPDDMATVLRAGITLIDEQGVRYDYVDGVLNPYRFEDEHAEGAISDWDMCDGETILRLKEPTDINATLMCNPFRFGD